jgi:tRNA (cytosine34-C5)-methyltransferase
MPKRKNVSKHGQSETKINPLAQARGRRNNQVAAAAQEVWFRKSGLGYDLFVQYYVHQCPDLIIQEYPQAQPSSSSSAQAAIVTGGGRGQSRAAKRRRRNNQRKQQQQAEDVPVKQTEEQITETALLCSSSSSSAVTEAHPLMQAFHNIMNRQTNKKGNDKSWSSPFFRTLSQPLPITFRIRRTAHSDEFSLLQQLLEQPPFSKTSFIVTKIDWGKQQHQQQQPGQPPPNATSDWIYQCSSTVMDNKNDNSLMTTLKDILFQYSQNGVLARQELGSMLPGLVIDSFFDRCHHSWKRKSITSKENRWHHFRVLDMCASPGSKTLQIFENDPQLLIANDIHPGRLEALKDAIARSGVPNASENIIFSCQDATKVELLAQKTNHTVTTLNGSKTTPSLLKFDIILCDVPCSGDGTCRKDPHVLRNWKPSIGNQLHSTQVAILSRAVELLRKNGGVVCYSTCSLNPVENEAVVAAVLQKYGNLIELVEIPTISSGLKLRDGIPQWKVAHWNGEDDKTHTLLQDDLVGEDDDAMTHLQLTWFDSYDDALAVTKTRNPVQQWMPSLWPPSTATTMNLSYCKRLCPHDQNSGGFFVALLRHRAK